MKSNLMTIMKKELARFFGDKRMVMSTIILPGLLIYVVYSFMGQGMMSQFDTDDTYVAKAYVQNMPQEMTSTFESLSVDWSEVPEGTDIETLKTEVQDKEKDLILLFPEDFVAQTASYEVASGAAAPNVQIYYNSTESESTKLRGIIVEILDAYEASMANKLDINAGEEQYDCASERDVTGMLFAMMLPMLLMIFLYSGCIAVAPESIAGEKERGTIATLLVTPMKRSSLALGKICSISIIALLSGISSGLGTILSLPHLMGDSLGGISSSVYSAGDYLMLLGIILSTVLVLVSAISVISAFSRSVKEANTAVSPLMILVMFLSVTTMFGSEGEKALGLFAIPLYNSVQGMQGIFSFSIQPAQVLLTMGVNLLTAGVLTFVLTRLFNSEKVMFGK